MTEWVVTGSEGSGEFFSDEWYIDSSDGEPVAIVNGEANAHLMVTSPETTKALISLCHEFEHVVAVPTVFTAYNEAMAAIAKAKG